LQGGSTVLAYFSLSRTRWTVFSGSGLALGFVGQACIAAFALLVLLLGGPSSQGQDQRGTVVLEENRGAAVTNGNYYALVIGIDEYPSPLPSLKTAVADAQAVSSELREDYGFQVQLLLNRDATRAHILDAITRYRDTLSANDNLLIYYAGHGYSDHEADKAYWLPADADSSFSANRIIADDLTTGVRVLPARHVLVISDSCYSGTLTRDVNAPVQSGGQAAFISRMLQSRSRTLMASGGDEPVSDQGTNGHSVFAYALLRALELTEGQMFTASDMFYGSVRGQVAGKSEQVPEYSIIRNSSHDDGDFVFSRKAASAETLRPSEAVTISTRTPVHSDLALVATEGKADDFSEETLSKEKWSIGKGWQLVPEPTSHPGSYYPALSIVGTGIGYLLPPSANTQYYDFTENFQVLIFAPAVQDSFTWLVRLRPASTGKYSYYRFTFDFPDKSTKTGKVSACLVVDDIVSRSLDAQEAAQLKFKGPFSAAPGAPSLLQITTVVETQPAGGGVKFTIKLRYNDLSRPFDSPEYITPQLRQREFVDYKNELKWGTVGFTAPAHGSESKIMAFSLTPLLPGGKP
jgi:Caspase domain